MTKHCFCGNDLFQKNLIAELKKYSKQECMKVEHLNFGVWMLGKQKWDYYPPKSTCFIYIPNRYKERKVFEKKS